MKNLGRKGLNLSLDLMTIATGFIGIFNFFRGKNQPVKKEETTTIEPIRIDLGDKGQVVACYCGQAECNSNSRHREGATATTTNIEKLEK